MQVKIWYFFKLVDTHTFTNINYKCIFLSLAKVYDLDIDVLMQHDLMSDINMLYVGRLPDITTNLPIVTHLKWLLNTMSHIIYSFIYFSVIFIFVMKSNSVIGIYLKLVVVIFYIGLKRRVSSIIPQKYLVRRQRIPE